MNIQVCTKIFVPSLLSVFVLSMVAGPYGQDVLGQTTQEQTAAANANMTAADFNAVTSNLITARQGILINDSTSAYNAINTAGSELFKLRQDAAGGNETLAKELIKQFRPIQINIDSAHDAVQDDNSTQVLRSLNNADIRVLYVTQELPPGEGDAEAETAE
jgi:sensor histidine kinase regulating citrate/malate metabolism